jgi:protein-disulfide isomerase
MSGTRREIIIGGMATAALSACGPSGGGGGSAGLDASDMAIGEPTAKVTVIEYASVTCPHCREFHEKVWPQLKANYIDTGKIRFVFREFPTPPQEVAVAGFQVARCAAGTDAQKYFSVIDILFEQQAQVFEALQKGTVRQQLLLIAQSAGVSEDAFNACITDPAASKRIADTTEKGINVFKITGTPSLIVDGKLLGAEGVTYEGLSKAIDAKLTG